MKKLATIIVSGLLLAGCGGAEPEAAPEPEPTSEATEEPTPEPSADASAADASARVACRHWANIAGDASSGVLTDEELRGKVKEVHDSAWVSETPEIASSAEGMLAGVTQGDVDAFTSHAGTFTDACIGSGALD